MTLSSEKKCKPSFQYVHLLQWFQKHILLYTNFYPNEQKSLEFGASSFTFKHPLCSDSAHQAQCIQICKGCSGSLTHEPKGWTSESGNKLQNTKICTYIYIYIRVRMYIYICICLMHMYIYIYVLSKLQMDLCMHIHILSCLPISWIICTSISILIHSCQWMQYMYPYLLIYVSFSLNVAV